MLITCEVCILDSRLLYCLSYFGWVHLSVLTAACTFYQMSTRFSSFLVFFFFIIIYVVAFCCLVVLLRMHLRKIGQRLNWVLMWLHNWGLTIYHYSMNLAGLEIVAFFAGGVGFFMLLFPATRPNLYNHRITECNCWQAYCILDQWILFIYLGASGGSIS